MHAIEVAKHLGTLGALSRAHSGTMAAAASSATPPDNFSMVWRGVYRSGFPARKNFGFLRKVRGRAVACERVGWRGVVAD